MTVVDTRKDPQALTLTIVSEFPAPVEKVWDVWADVRKLERWWGPPTWPATFTQHELRPGGQSRYYMTGPEGEKAHGWWEIVSVDAPSGLSFDDGFGDDTGEPQADGPVTRAEVSIEPGGAGTRMTITSRFATLDDLEKLSAMGMVEGMSEALGQLDAILAES